MPQRHDMKHPSTTIPIDFVRQLLERPNLDEYTRKACLTHAGIPAELLAAPRPNSSRCFTNW